MQKVITVTTHTNTLLDGETFKENEYPLIDSYLKDGYCVKQIVPVTLNSTSAYMYSLSFVLEK